MGGDGRLSSPFKLVREKTDLKVTHLLLPSFMHHGQGLRVKRQSSSAQQSHSAADGRRKATQLALGASAKKAE